MSEPKPRRLRRNATVLVTEMSDRGARGTKTVAGRRGGAISECSAAPRMPEKASKQDVAARRDGVLPTDRKVRFRARDGRPKGRDRPVPGSVYDSPAAGQKAGRALNKLRKKMYYLRKVGSENLCPENLSVWRQSKALEAAV